MTLLAGAAEVEITPPFPVDLLGYIRRPLAARFAYEPLMATACVFRDEEDGTTVAIIAADVVGLTTPMADRILDGVSAEERSAWESMLPLGRFSSSDEIASVIHHLLSREASYTNGLVYAIDGGETAGLYTGGAPAPD